MRRGDTSLPGLPKQVPGVHPRVEVTGHPSETAGGQIPGVEGPFHFEFQRNYRQEACEVGTRLRLLVAGCGAPIWPPRGGPWL